jgi:hypothetical protein
VTFLHPWFLFGLAAASVPLLLHVIQTQRIRKVYFSTLHFLKMVHKRRSLRIRVSRLLLLLARIGLATLLTLAFAQPYFVNPSFAFLNTGPRTVGILWDNSGATRALDGPASVLEKARGRLAEFGKSLGPRDNVVVVATSPAPSVVYRGRAGDLAAAKLPGSTAAAADRPRALEVLDDAMAQLPATETMIAVFADFRAAAWPAGAVRTTKGAKVLLFPGRVADYANWSLARVEATPPAVAAGEPVVINLTLAYYTARAAQPTTVVVKVDGKIVDRKTMASSPEPIRTQVVLNGLKDGVHRVQLTLSNDSLPLDNERELSVRVLPYRRVLTVNGKKRATPALDEGWFLRRVVGTATEPRRGFLAREVLELNEAEDLRDVQLVVLANLKAASPSLEKKLARYVDRGGTLLVFLGDQTDPASMNSGLLRWTGWELDRRNEGGGALAIDEAAFGDLEHLADESFWRPVAVERYFLFRPKAAVERGRAATGETRGHASAPLALPDGNPYMLVAGRGTGTAVFVNASASTESSDLPLHAAFPVLVSECSRLSTGRKLQQHVAGERVVLPLSSEDMNAVLTVQDPSGKLTALKPAHAKDQLYASYEHAHEPGLYTFTRRTPDDAAVTPFLVVPPPKESDLTLLAPPDLTARFPGASIVEGKPTGAKVGARMGGGVTLSDLLIWGVVLLVALELFLVWDLERHLRAEGADSEGRDVL